MLGDTWIWLWISISCETIRFWGFCRFSLFCFYCYSMPLCWSNCYKWIHLDFFYIAFTLGFVLHRHKKPIILWLEFFDKNWLGQPEKHFFLFPKRPCKMIKWDKWSGVKKANWINKFYVFWKYNRRISRNLLPNGKIQFEIELILIQLTPYLNVSLC